jgi:hypothetical protein
MRRRPLLGDVGDGHAEDARHDESLQKTPHDERAERLRRGGEHRRQSEDQRRGHDQSAAAEAPGQKTVERCGERDAESRGADRHPDRGFRRVKDAGECRQQRLRRVEIEKRSHAGERHRDDGRDRRHRRDEHRFEIFDSLAADDDGIGGVFRTAHPLTLHQMRRRASTCGAARFSAPSAG